MKEFINQKLVPVDHDPFTGPEIERSVPTTEPQKEIWASVQMHPDASCAYNESITLILRGKVEVALLKKSLQLLVHRHEGLRASFSKNCASMNILKQAIVSISEHDVSPLSDPEKQQQFDKLIEEDQKTSFDIVNGPMFRNMIIKIFDWEYRLVMNAHHMICDGWSMGVMMADVSQIYSSLVKDETPKLEPAYGSCDYAIDQIDIMASDEYKQVEGFWMKEFKNAPSDLDLPVDRERPDPRTYAGARYDAELEQDIVKGIKQIGTAQASSFVTTLLSTFELYLRKLTGQKDIVLGLPAAGQSDSGHTYLVGHCVNLLALRSNVKEGENFVDYLKGRKTGILDAFDNQKYTFGSLIQKLGLPRKPGRIPLVPVVFNIDMNMDDGVTFESLEHEWVSNPRFFENFEIFLNATGSEEKLILEWSYKTDLFDEATIAKMMDGYRDLLKEVIANPEIGLAELMIKKADSASSRDGSDEKSRSSTAKEEADTAPEKKETPALPYDPAWSGVTTSFPKDKTVIDLFNETVVLHGDRTALIFEKDKLTYQELNDLSNALAAQLIEKGVQRGDLVGISMERCFEMIIGMLAALKVGAAFVPFDPSYPVERLEFMFKDTNVKLVITNELGALDVPVPEDSILIVDKDQLNANVDPISDGVANDLAYVMYTSGSTGQPKGVCVPNRAIVRLVRNTNYLEFSKELVFLQLSNISFDASTLEIWGALLNGAQLVLIPQQKPTLSEITEAIHRYGVTTTWFTSGLFNLLVDEHLIELATLKNILTGGDVLSVPHIQKALETLGPGVLINGYGPTENTTFTCCYPIDDLNDIPGSIPIGYPISNTQVYILDENGKPVGVGEEGELHTGGSGLALGYLNQEELTAEKFINDPFSNEVKAKMYKTGDLVRWLADGRIEFVGRVDNQIKLRGFRIELGEIEAALLQLDDVKDGVVICREDSSNDKQIVAYYMASDENAEEIPNEIRSNIERTLRSQLPDYMVPSAFVQMPELPLNPNGKVDRKALPQPEIRTHDRNDQFESPRNHLERTLASIWQQLLGVEQIGVHDNFFELGGHSLLGISMFEQIKKQFDQELSLSALFQAPTVAKLASMLKEGGYEQKWENLSPIQPNGSLPPFFCVHGDEANYFIPRYLGKEQPFYAFFHQGEDGSEIKYTKVEDLATHFIKEMKTVRAKGPYYLGGYSFGGIVAFEMAQQLIAEGEEIGLLAMFDTAEPNEHARTMDEEKKIYDPIKKAIMRPMAQRYLQGGNPIPPKLRHFYIIDTYDKAIHAYDAKKLKGDLTLFKANATTRDAKMGWEHLVEGDVTVHEVPGDHYSMIKEPDVRVLAEKLAHQLDQAYRARSVEAV